MEFVRSYDSIRFGLPRNRGGSAPALRFSRPAQRLLTLRPACSPSRQCDLLHRRLQQLRCLRRCFDCYRVERTSSRAGLTPAVDHHLSRRTRLSDAYQEVTLILSLTPTALVGSARAIKIGAANGLSERFRKNRKLLADSTSCASNALRGPPP
jgi:hypothetical protein